jgi:hypothetical protein
MSVYACVCGEAFYSMIGLRIHRYDCEQVAVKVGTFTVEQIAFTISQAPPTVANLMIKELLSSHPDVCEMEEYFNQYYDK